MIRTIFILLIITCFCLTGCFKKNIDNSSCAIEKSKLIKQITQLKEKIKISEYNLYKTKLAGDLDLFIKNANDTYPNYYGGKYISEDSKNLIIQIVKDNIPSKSNNKEYDKYYKMLNMDDSIKVEYVKNSYNDLNEVNNKIEEYFSSSDAEYDNLNGNYIDTLNNIVVVELLDNNKEEQEKFKEMVVDSDLIKFVQEKNGILIQ